MSSQPAHRPAAVPADGLPAAPRRLGDWLLGDVVACGSMATVYAARPARSPTAPPAYALKLLLPKWQDEPRAVDLLRREALVGRSVSHANLVSVFSAQTSRPPCYLVMPLLEGQTLSARMASGWNPPVSVVLWIGRQVSEALSALARAGWMHGDVKPDNVFVSARGHVTLLDLGFARRIDEERCAADRPVMGTLFYMAPETLTSRLRADARSDIYSLGVLLYELLAGRRPFAGDCAEVAAQQRGATPPALRSLSPIVPPAVAVLVHEMLAKDPLRRPQTPSEVAARLAALEIATFTAGRFEDEAAPQPLAPATAAIAAPHIAAPAPQRAGSPAPR